MTRTPGTETQITAESIEFALSTTVMFLLQFRSTGGGPASRARLSGAADAVLDRAEANAAAVSRWRGGGNGGRGRRPTAAAAAEPFCIVRGGHLDQSGGRRRVLRTVRRSQVGI